MKRSVLLLVFGLLAGAGGFAALYAWKTVPHQKAAREAGVPELAWLRAEFDLSEADLARISELHLGYLPRCETMCRRIEALQARLRPLVLDSREVTPEIEAMLAEAAELRRQCQVSMLNHFYAVSLAMPEAEGRRYLAKMQEMTLAGGSFHHSRHGHGH